MLQILEHTIEHALLDGVRLLPFLFLTYLAMEYLEHKASVKTGEWVQKSGRLGPLAGGLLGVVPQCGFSAAASNFYAGRVITLGTLMAVYLSTSDEMLPIMISEQVPVGLILKVLAAKAAIGITAGFLIDFIYRPRREEHHHIHEICEHEHCQCEKGIFRSALWHTLQIFLFILLVGFVLELFLQLVGEDTLGNMILNRPIIGPVLAGLVGLIPNCAASVAITELFLNGALSFGAMLAGLLVNAGVGLVVLFKVNHNKRENIRILVLLYVIGISVGSIISLEAL
ncbi:MAG: arsenic efflux protein [Roseburia sp.]|nr:arsenic efflux protein [Roseburia sp.]